MEQPLDFGQLPGQVVVDVEPARRVEDHQARAPGAGSLDRGRAGCDRIRYARIRCDRIGRYRVEKFDVRPVRQPPELFGRGRPFRIARDDQRTLRPEVMPELCRGRRFADALEPDQRDDRRRLAPFDRSPIPDRRPLPAQQPDQFLVDDARDLVSRPEAGQDRFGLERTGQPEAELLDHLIVDVRFEQKKPDVFERGVDLLRAQPAVPGERAPEPDEFVRYRPEHCSALTTGR